MVGRRDLTGLVPTLAVQISVLCTIVEHRTISTERDLDYGWMFVVKAISGY